MIKTVTLGEICEVYGGGTPPREVKEYFGGDIPWLTPTEIVKDTIGYVGTSRETLTEKGFSKSSAKLLPVGSVLMTSRASIGNVAIAKNPVTTNQGFISFVCSKDLHNRYLAYWLLVNKPKFENAANGATFKEISRSTLKAFRLPLPSLPRQRQIAAILDRGDSLRQKDRQLLAYYDQLAQSTFMDLFGDPVRNEKGWPTESIRSLSNFITDGPFGSNLKTEHYRTSGVRVIRLNNIGVGEFLDTNKAYVSEEHHRKVLKKNTCLPGDVLIGTLGEPNLRACILPDYIPIAINKADCVLCKPNDKKITARYLTAVINNPGTLSLASRSMRGQTRIRMSMGQVAMLKIAVPPLTLQQQFAIVIDQIERQKAFAQQQNTASEDLFQRLLQDSFGD